MKKILPVSLIVLSIFLVSCGKKNLDNIIITPDTPIENKDQSAKMCEPVIKYLECSLAKAPDAAKSKYEKAIQDMQRKIKNDDPVKVAQDCNTTIKILQNKADVVSKNGCFIEPAFTTQTPETEASETNPVESIQPKTESVTQ